MERVVVKNAAEVLVPQEWCERAGSGICRCILPYSAIFPIMGVVYWDEWGEDGFSPCEMP